MARFFVLLTLLASAAMAQTPGPESGRYGPDLSIAVGADGEISGWLDRSDEMDECRVYLYAKAAANRWRLVLYSPAYDDVLAGGLVVGEASVRLLLTRAPRGCEAEYGWFTAGPEFGLTQPRSWQRIALSRPGATVRERGAADAPVIQTLGYYQPWAVTASRRGYRAGLALSRDGGIAGWMAADDLLPALAHSLMTDRLERPLPGLSAPATLTQRRQWQQLLDWSDRCETRFQGQRGRDGGLALIQVAPQYALLRISCGRTQYQDSFIYAWIRLGLPEQTRLLTFEGYPPARTGRLSSAHSLIVGQDEIDVRSYTLLLYSRWDREMECGQLLRFKLNLEGPELTEWRERDCDAAAAVGDANAELSPLQWPLKEGSDEADEG